MLMLEGGAASSDHRDELAYIDEVEGGDEALLEEVLTPLKKLEEKVSARLAEGQELGLGVFLCHLHAVYVVEVQGGVSHGEELLFALETDYVCYIPLIYFNL